MHRLFDLLQSTGSGISRWLTLSLLLLCSLPLQASDHIRLGIQLEPPTLDPTATAAASAGEITWCNVFEGLTLVDGGGMLKPRLAREWHLSEDGLTYTFEDRKSVV